MAERGDNASKPSWQIAVSLVLVAHLFLLFVALSASYAPSRVQARILSRFGVYTQTLNLDRNSIPYEFPTPYPNFAPYHLTHATMDDVDHRIEVLPEGKDPDSDADWIVLPDVGTRGTDRYQRYQRMARMMAFFAQQDEVTASLARDVGAHFLRQRGIRPQRVRCRKHMLQPYGVIQGGTSEQRDPNDPSYFRVVYDANIVISRTGAVSVVKLAQDSEVAQPTSRDEERNAGDS
jgi:hypothetical protein